MEKSESFISYGERVKTEPAVALGPLNGWGEETGINILSPKNS
ncbi:hypothetical protein [Caenibacillus caldisaponilyticus]|nr:hypothetical protein [Caenibacillus caldisaponilyticus]